MIQIIVPRELEFGVSKPKPNGVNLFFGKSQNLTDQIDTGVGKDLGRFGIGGRVVVKHFFVEMGIPGRRKTQKYFFLFGLSGFQLGIDPLLIFTRSFGGVNNRSSK